MLSEKDKKWLKENWEAYIDNWVALKDGECISWGTTIYYMIQCSSITEYNIVEIRKDKSGNPTFYQHENFSKRIVDGVIT